MKKAILFFSLIIVGTFIMFGFSPSINLTNTSDNVKVIEKQNNSELQKTFKISNVNRANSDKCGAGKCGAGKAKKAAKSESKCGAGKCGEGKAEGKKHNFMDKDSNGDGKVSMAEFKAFSVKEFPKKDKNGDGKITSDECPMFDKFNTDGNDVLSKDEFFKGHTMMFNKLDKNQDGFVTKAESKDMQSSDSKCGAGKCG